MLYTYFFNLLQNTLSIRVPSPGTSGPNCFRPNKNVDFYEKKCLVHVSHVDQSMYVFSKKISNIQLQMDDVFSVLVLVSLFNNIFFFCFLGFVYFLVWEMSHLHGVLFYSQFKLLHKGKYTYNQDYPLNQLPQSLA